MPFLHALIYSKIEGANTARVNERSKTSTRDMRKGEGGEKNEIERDQLEEFAESLEGISHSVVMEASQLESHRLEQGR